MSIYIYIYIHRYLYPAPRCSSSWAVSSRDRIRPITFVVAPLLPLRDGMRAWCKEKGASLAEGAQLKGVDRIVGGKMGVCVSEGVRERKGAFLAERGLLKVVGRVVGGKMGVYAGKKNTANY